MPNEVPLNILRQFGGFLFDLLNIVLSKVPEPSVIGLQYFLYTLGLRNCNEPDRMCCGFQVFRDLCLCGRNASENGGDVLLDHRLLLLHII